MPLLDDLDAGKAALGAKRWLSKAPRSGSTAKHHSEAEGPQFVLQETPIFVFKLIGVS